VNRLRQRVPLVRNRMGKSGLSIEVRAGQ
jgi:hypothetical protein